MPDLPDRQRREAELTAAILLLFGDHLRAMATGGRVATSIPPALVETLRDTFLDSAGQLSRQKIGVDNREGEAEANAWALHRAGQIVNQVTATDQRLSTRATSMEPAQVERNLANRASMIGATEITAAITAGEAFAVYVLLNYRGLQLTTTWYTEQDGRVCEVCEALHGTEPEVYDMVSPGGPPAHPWCRCWLEHEGAMA